MNALLDPKGLDLNMELSHWLLVSCARKGLVHNIFGPKEDTQAVQSANWLLPSLLLLVGQKPSPRSNDSAVTFKPAGASQTKYVTAQTGSSSHVFVLRTGIACSAGTTLAPV